MSGVQLPNLPGFVSNRHKAGPRKQTLKFGLAGAEVSYGPEGDSPMFFGGKNEWDPSVTRSKAREAAERSSVINRIAEGRSEMSTWHILTLNAYWKEELQTGNYPYRIREFILLYYTDDDTLEIREKRKANSGLPQGQFVKKHKVAKGTDGSFYTARDLQPGKSISVYGRVFHILSCGDAVTRDTLSKLGVDVSVEQTAPRSPEDIETEKRNASVDVAANRQFKDYNETMLGGNGVQVRKLGAFLDFGTTPPLKFLSVWRDDRMYGDLNRYTISFYLEDRTFKIIDDVHGNEGKGPFTTMLKRQKIPKQYKVDAAHIGANISGQFYDVNDLYVGNVVPCHGRQLLIIDAAPTTRDFYATQAKHNPAFHEQPEAIVLEEDQVDFTIPRQEPVPYLGGVVTFGSEQASLQSCLSLHPIKPRHDPEKVKGNQLASLKFSADLISSKPEDAGRKFVISFFMYDETVSVFEEGRKNSGIVPGKFLKRTKLRNPQGRFFSTDDFYVGAKVQINDFLFTLTGLDAFSLNYAIHRPHQFAWANLQRLIEEIRGRIHENTTFGNSPTVGEADPNTTISTESLIVFLESFLSKPELAAILPFFSNANHPVLTFGLLREFLRLPFENFSELIASDCLHTVVEDSKMQTDRRLLKKSIQKIRHGLAHAQASFQGIINSLKDEHGNIQQGNLIKALEEAKYISNVPILPQDISKVADYFFPDSTASLSAMKFYRFLFERTSVISVGRTRHQFNH